MKDKNSQIHLLDEILNFNDLDSSESKFHDLLQQSDVLSDKDLNLEINILLARIQFLKGNYGDAQKKLEQLELKVSSGTPGAELRLFVEKGRILNQIGQQDKAEALLKKAYDLALVRHRDYLAIEIAHLLSVAEGQIERQMDWNLKGILIAEKSKDDKVKIWLNTLYISMGWLNHRLKNYDAALDLFHKALSFRKKKGDAAGVRNAMWCIAKTYRSMRKIEEALKLQLALEKDYLQLGKVDGQVYEELGEIYLIQGNPELSKKYFILAYQQIKDDPWMKTHEPSRLRRIKDLSGVKTPSENS